MLKLNYYLGQVGVSGAEKPFVRHLSRLFDFLMAIIAVLLFAEWHLSLMNVLHNGTAMAINWLVFLFFALRFVVFSLLVTDKARYVMFNWFTPLVILFMIPLLVSPHFAPRLYMVIRPILAVLMYVPWLGLIRLSLVDGKLSTTLISLVFVVVLSGVLITGVDPAFKTVGNGIWWAWVTMSTVGYGDYVPLTVGGKILGSIIILLGLCFFAILTANFSKLFIKRTMSDVWRDAEAEIEREKRLEERFVRLEKKLDALLEEKSRDK
ncbi:MAG: hypothetical protein COV52_07395 [Gammaproteobacteria bacterium CG11_big_fil_rev_8_21_14_0_20_46_22]|nr:MAG: hypothetical protein COW05_00410 [Gammaproteobacteria bacterium CG12_big_fil_rev_8_21_14_0_65_46_12]PIR10856.1 MAG: hypothetical protein COV52_07395 [Gammaproteobacteria bacterium CG11_big_fil_rev_8_21_14_0_20_46_22]